MRLHMMAMALGCLICAPGICGEEVEDPFAGVIASLKLTPTQTEAVGPILREQGQKTRALMEGASGQGPEAFRALDKQISVIDSETDRRLARHMSDEQLASYQRWRTDNRARIRGRLMRID